MAESLDSKPKRVDIGFQGGQVLGLRMPEAAYKGLREALESDRSPRWHELQTEDSQVAVDLAQVVYVRLDTEHQRGGF